MQYIKLSTYRFINQLHIRIFQQPISNELKQFIANLFWSFLGGSISSAVMLALNIIGGRLMGPVEYGKYNLIFIFSQYIIIFMFFGLDIASIRAIASHKNKKEKNSHMGSASSFVLFALVLFTILYLSLYQQIAQKFSINPELLKITLFLTILLVIKSLADILIRGLHDFKLQSKAKIAEVAAASITFIILFFGLNARHYSDYALSIMVGAVIVILIYLFKLPIKEFRFSIISLKEQLSHGQLFFITAIIGTTFVSLDKLFVGKYLNIYQLGIYSAYYLASITMVTQITQMLINVLLPTVAALEDKSFIKKIDRLFKLGFIPLVVFVSLTTFLIIKLYGEKYSLNYSYILLFSLFSALQIFQIIYNSIILTFKKSIYKKYMVYLNTLSLLTILAYPVMAYLKIISIHLILTALIINTLLSLILQKIIINKAAD